MVKGDFLKWMFWGKMCCKAPGGKYAQFRKVEKRKIEKWKDVFVNFESRKVEKYTF